MQNVRDIHFKVLCDNYLEFDRFFKIACSALTLNEREFEYKKTIPIGLYNQNLNISFIVLVGFNRWGDNYWNSSLNNSLYISENPDVLVLMHTESIEKLFAIEFCSALPAGNQSWQRFARGKQLSENNTDYFFISDVGGVELGKNRKKLSIRYPNPIVNYAASKHNKKDSTGLFINLLIKKPGCPDEIIEDIKSSIGVQLLEKYIHNLVINQVSNSFDDHQDKLIKYYIGAKKRLSSFEEDIENNILPVHYDQVISGWKKKYSIPVSLKAKNILDIAGKYSNAYYGKDLPFTSIKKDFSNDFCNGVNNILQNKLKLGFSNGQEIFFCALAGFKPRGDDARPDRGLVPLLDSIAGKNTIIITLVFGPALSGVEDQLKSNHKSLCSKNGLWGSVFQNSDFVIVTSLNFEDAMILCGDRGDSRKSLEKFTIHDDSIIPAPNENDVDSAIHLTLSKECGLFESIFNPPGGDWSGVSFYKESSHEEIRYLTLPRAPDSLKNKRPDHIYHDFKNRTVYVVESKTYISSLRKEHDVGNKMINWTNELIKYIPQVKKEDDREWTTKTEEMDKLLNVKFVRCGAFMAKKETIDDYMRVMKNCSLDLLFLYILDEKSWTIKVIFNNSNILIPKCLQSLDRLHA